MKEVLDMKEQLQKIKDTMGSEVSDVKDRVIDKVEINKINTYNNKKHFDWKNREYKRGEVYFADCSGNLFSEQGNGADGLRAVVIIQNDIGNKFSPTVIIASLTSVLSKSKLPCHVELMKTEFNLPKNSIALFEQVRTIDKRRLVGEKLCYLGDDMQKELDNAVIISMTNCPPKSLIEKIPADMRNYIIATLKDVYEYEKGIEKMKLNKINQDAIKVMIDVKLSLLNKFMKYCREHQLPYDEFYKLNKGVSKEVLELVVDMAV